jgi:hypothetical protein
VTSEALIPGTEQHFVDVKRRKIAEMSTEKKNNNQDDAFGNLIKSIEDSGKNTHLPLAEHKMSDLS